MAFCFLAGLSATEWSKRRVLLRQLHCDSKLPITHASSYAEDMIKPLARLQMLVDTGHMATLDERERIAIEKEANEKARKKIYQVLEGVRAGSREIFRQRKNYDQLAELTAKHIDIFLDNATLTESDSQYQIGYYYNRLSVALVKQKQWAEAKRRLEQYYTLPVQFRYSTSPSADKKLRARLERCSKLLAKE